ncbi:hypothetical protein HY374_00080 [Candidatus Berkelbacteria bacterium]|nr:hypothetical protein [Candidatus Berkelbacteria bacterium]
MDDTDFTPSQVEQLQTIVQGAIGQETRALFEEHRSTMTYETRQIVREELAPIKEKLDRIDKRTDEDLRAESKRITTLERRTAKLEVKAA